MQLAGFSELAPIGAGGIGDVYRAVSASTGDVVAVKVLRDATDSSAAWRRTRRELTALTALSGHDHVVGVLEIVDHPDGPALVMEYAPGGSVAALLAGEGGRLTVPQAVMVGRHAASALVAAHQHGIVHRDVKPQNLLIDGSGQVKLCDFGIAALLRSEEFRGRTSAVSARYASPEDLDEDELTTASDVYSLGATLLHLVHGAPPTIRDRLAAWTPPAGADPGVTAVDAVIAPCLDPAPLGRPTAREVADRLETIDRELPDRCDALTVVTSAPPPIGAAGHLDRDRDPDATLVRDGLAATDPPTPHRHATRRRWPWTAAAVAAAVSIGVGLATLQSRTDPAPVASPTSTAPDGAGTTTGTATTTGAPDDGATTPAAPVTIVDRPPDLEPLDVDTTRWPFGSEGECLVQVSGLAELMPVDCAEPHDLQRFHVGALADAIVDPESDTARSEVRAACHDAFAAFVGDGAIAGALSVAATRPSEASWIEGDRRYQCLLGVPGRHVVGDVAADAS